MRAVRRHGFTAGLSVGGGLLQAAGFPNDAKKIGRARWYTETSIGPAASGGFWVGGTFTDWLTFGVGLDVATAAAGDHAVRAGALAFHVEAFPAWSLGGPFREIGALFEAGTGLADVRSDTDELLVESGAASRVAFGGFYEGLRVSRLSMGPYALGELMWSESLRRGGVFLGWRTAIYSGP